MTLIKSVSGVRGTIGGSPGNGLTPIDIISITSAYGSFIKEKYNNDKIVIGRDARISGQIVKELVINTLLSLGINIIDLDLSTTPTVEMAVIMEKAGGGIILTASHNPREWNALKLLNNKGEFISAEEGLEILERAENQNFEYANIDQIGKLKKDSSYIQKHIDAILQLPLVDVSAIKTKKFKVVIDTVNSTGAISLVPLLNALGVEKIIHLYDSVDGHFEHNPEPLPEHLIALSESVKLNNADLGIAVDPDVDRLALVNEDGTFFGEEYTLVAVSDYVLQNKKGNTVSNLSSSRALTDVTLNNGGEHFASAVGEVHVVVKMKEVKAVIGGEGNGGIIYPELHYGRDALVGVALFLTHLAKSEMTMTSLKSTYPPYFISKNKISLQEGMDVDGILEKMKVKYSNNKINDVDGVRIDFEKEKQWVHLRKSNTEPIIRIYAESENKDSADSLANKIIEDIKSLIS